MKTEGGMKKWGMATIGLLAMSPLAANAGFDIDPSLVSAASPSPKPAPALAPMAIASLPGSPAVAADGAAAPSPFVPTTPLSSPSAAWNEKITGFAHSEAAQVSLTHLVPTGGHLIVKAPVAATIRVSWTGNDSRIAIARKVLLDAKLNGRFDGDNLIIDAPTPAQSPTARASTLPGSTPQTSAGADPSVTPRLWTLAKGVMLSDGINDWMEQTTAGGERFRWTLQWDAFDGVNREHRVDYLIVAPLRFTGTIDEAIAQVVMLYKKSTKPLAVEIAKDQRVIHITLRGSN
jgi:hypothetical protein